MRQSFGHALRMVLAGALVALASPAVAAPDAAVPKPAPTPAVPSPPADPAYIEPGWDRVANIKAAADRLGKIQRARGATAAMAFIDACYKTHGLASAYAAAFEACIAKDYMETKLLTNVYARLPPETLARMKVPSPAVLAQSMGRRIVAAFSQYKVPVAYAETLKALVDEHGLPVFLATVFPGSKRPGAPQLKDLPNFTEPPAAGKEPPKEP